jgi:hypothetical protein
MGSLAIVTLAIVMAGFGIYGYQRGTKVGVLMAGMIVGALLLMSIFGQEMVTLINGIDKAIRFAFGGGLQALGGGTAGAGAALAQMQSAQPLVSAESPGTAVVLVVGTAVVLAFFLGLLKAFRGSPSFAGLVLGLISGYLVTAYLLAALVPQAGLLPLPITIPGLSAATPPGNLSVGLTWNIDQWMQDLANLKCLPIAIAVSIAALAFVAMRMGSRSGKKG